MAKPHYVSETQILQRVARNPECTFLWTPHARKSLKDDGRTTVDVEHALMNSQVTFHEQKKDLLWRAEGKDLDGKTVVAIVSVRQAEITIKIVTTF